MDDLDWNRFDGFYLFNPFQENRTPEQKIDPDVSLSPKLFTSYVQFVERSLGGLAQGRARGHVFRLWRALFRPLSRG